MISLRECDFVLCMREREKERENDREIFVVSTSLIGGIS